MTESESYSLHDEIPKETFPTGEIIPFKPNPKGPKDTDWLSGLEQDTVFLAKHKGQNPVVFSEYKVYNATSTLTSRCLINYINHDLLQYAWVNPIEFCKSMDLVEIVRIP